MAGELSIHEKGNDVGCALARPAQPIAVAIGSNTRAVETLHKHVVTRCACL